MNWTLDRYLDAKAVENALTHLFNNIQNASLDDDEVTYCLRDFCGRWVHASEAGQPERFVDAKAEAIRTRVDAMRQTRDTSTCRKCAAEFAFYWQPAYEAPRLQQRPKICCQCHGKQQIEEARSKRVSAFYDANPLAHSYLWAMGEPPRPAQYQTLMDWNGDYDPDAPQKLGFVLVGDSFTGKTTACYKAAYKLVEAHQFEDFLAVNSGQLNTIPEKVLDRSLSEFLETLHYADLLLIDDLDKVRITPRVASEIWTLFETRLRDRRLPLLITMNTRTKRDFIRLFSGRDADSRQIGLSIYNRIRQACQFIDFDVETQPADPPTSGTDRPSLQEPTASGNPN